MRRPNSIGAQSGGDSQIKIRRIYADKNLRPTQKQIANKPPPQFQYGRQPQKRIPISQDGEPLAGKKNLGAGRAHIFAANADNFYLRNSPNERPCESRRQSVAGKFARNNRR